MLAQRLPGRLKKPQWIALLLALAVAVQAALLLKDYVRPLAWAIRRFGLVSSLERSEIMYMGADQAKYLRFLREVVPIEASVVIPGGDSGFASQSVMQFYLLPRTIHSQCGGGEITEACLQVLTDPTSFVLAVDGFPQLQEIPGKVFLAYPDANGELQGVFAPAGLAGSIRADVDVYGVTRSIPVSAPFIDAGVLLAFLLLGSLYAITILRSPGWLEILSLSMPLGMAILSWSMFITSYLGVPIALASVGVEYALLVGLALGLHLAIRRSLPHFPPVDWQALSPRKLFKQDWAGSLLGLFAFLWLGLSGLVSLGRTYTVFDDIANWCLKGYAMAHQGSIQAGSLWGGHVLAYPLNIQLSIAVFWLADGDSLPGSKVLFPLLAVSILLGCYRFWRNHGIDPRLSILGLLLIFSTPVFFVHSTIGVANLPFAAYLVPGTLWSVEALKERKGGSFLMAGILLAGAAWTRPEGIGFGVITALTLLAAAWPTKLRVRWQQALLYVAPMAFPAAWLVLLGAHNMRIDQVGLTLRSFLPAFFRGDTHLGDMLALGAYSFHYFTNWSKAGFSAVLSLLALTVALPITRWHRDPICRTLAIITLVAALVQAAMLFAGSYNYADFGVFLPEIFDRSFLPTVILLLVLAILAMRPARQVPAA